MSPLPHPALLCALVLTITAQTTVACSPGCCPCGYCPCDECCCCAGLQWNAPRELHVNSTEDSNVWVRVPGGMWMPESCVTEVPNGGSADEVPVCPHQPRLASEWSPVGAPEEQCYDQKATYTNAKGVVTQMNASFVVPPLPATAARQTVYLWPGFKGTSPTIGKPVLQPVLQYGQHGAKWELQSWAVGVPGGAVTAPTIAVKEGDQLTTYMDLAGDTWTIFGKNLRTGETTDLKISTKKAGGTFTKADYAVFVSENVMARNKCDYYPANKGVDFTGIKVNSEAVTGWKTAYDCGSPDCGQKVIVSGDGTSIQLTWNP